MVSNHIFVNVSYLLKVQYATLIHSEMNFDPFVISFLTMFGQCISNTLQANIAERQTGEGPVEKKTLRFTTDKLDNYTQLFI